MPTTEQLPLSPSAPPTPSAGVSVHPTVKEAAIGPGEGKAPVSVYEALSEAGILMTEWEEKHRLEPAAYHEPGKCCDCGGAIPKPIIIMAGPLPIPFIRCNGCIAKKIEEQKVEAEKAFVNSVGAWCPPEFSKPWDASRGNGPLYTEVFKRFSFSTRKGLLLFGASGTCKTRVSWELVKHMHKTATDDFRFLFLDAYEIATKGIPAEAYTIPLLIIDDLGNEPLGPKNEKGLLHLIRKRCDWHKPMILTTQLDAKGFKDAFFSGTTGEAAVRRLRERSEIIDVGKLSTTKGGAAPA